MKVLGLTKSHDGAYSAFRAGNLLNILYASFRTTEQLERFGDWVYDNRETAIVVWKIAFYTENTLEALKRLQTDPSLTPQVAAQSVVAEAEAETRRAWDERNQAAQAGRQAAVDAEVERVASGQAAATAGGQGSRGEGSHAKL